MGNSQNSSIQSNNKFNYIKLNTSDKKVLISQLETAYQCELDSLKENDFYKNTQDKIFMFKGDDTDIDLSRVNLKGIYFGTYSDNKTFRLSLEGSYLVNPKVNYVVLKEESISAYLSATEMIDSMFETIKRNEEFPYLIVKYKDENLGTISGKQEPYFNYIPKARKLQKDKIF
jgi:NOL1/NOP2/fmu family ribosome biogenesis protein